LQASESKGLYNDRHPFETQIRRNDPPKSCEPYTAEKCRAVAEGLGLRLGGFGHAFEDNYSQKGCYAYRSGRYAGIAFYGSGGSDAEISNARTKRGDTYRPLGWDCSGDAPNGGSYPICYVAGVYHSERLPQLMQRSRYTAPYYFTAPECPRGWRHSGHAKSCGWWNYCAECIQNYWSCDKYPHHILHVGRKVPQPGQPIRKSDMPVAYCLDMSKMGNMW